MKRMLTVGLFIGLVGLPAAALFSTEKWTKPQQEVADVFKAWVEADLANDVEREMSLMAPALTAWDFAQPAPMDRAAYRQLLVDSFKQWKVTASAIEPTYIHIEGKTAVAQVRGTETLQDASGTKTTIGASWTATMTLIRDGKKWLVLGLGWADEPPKVDEAAIRREVAESMKAWFAAWARCDLEAAMSGVADTPDVLYSDIDGTQTDRAGLRKMGADAHVKVSAVIFSTLKERTNILAPDTVLYTWHGAVECAMKDGSTIRYDQMTMTILLRRTDGAWKVFHFHESALPAQQVRAPLTTTTTATPDRPAGTAQWSPSQLEALGVLQAACDAEKRNDFEGLSHLYHERFVAWDLSQASTLNRAAHLEAEADYLKNFKVIEATITPVAIQVADATAVVDVAYSMTTLAASDGEKATSKGRWNATLVKEGSRWLFLSCAWSEIK